VIVETITELTVVGVYDRGVANQERIVLQANEMLNMGQFGVMLGVKGADGTAFPIKDNLYWFGDGYVFKGDWVFLYTGPGEGRTTELPNSQEKMYTVHWGRDTTVLIDTNIVPILFRVDSIQVPVDAEVLPAQNT
jgi:hypothetical protein